jgi:hypothetical protein
MMGGGIAGVASNAKGESIKSINDQTDYSLWEFYYDPSKDLAPGMTGAVQTGARQSGTNGTTGFGQNSTTQNGFGSSSFSQSSTNSTDNSTNVPAMAAPRPMSASPQQ